MAGFGCDFSKKLGYKSNQMVRTDSVYYPLNCQDVVTVTPDTLVTRTRNLKVAFASTKVGVKMYREGAVGEIESRPNFSP